MRTFNPEANTPLKSFFFLDEDNMIRQRDPDWVLRGEHGKGDNLIRTGLGYIAWKDERLKVAILRCFERVNEDNGKYYYQPMRAPGGYGIEDVSRDQVVMAIASLAYNDDNSAKQIAGHLKWKLSKKYSQTVDTWLWFKGIAGKKLAAHLYMLYVILATPWMFLWNKIVGLFLGWKPIDQWYYDGDEVTKKIKEYGWFKRNLSALKYPIFALHLMCWQVYTTKSFLKPLAKFMIRLGLERDNTMLRILMGANKESLKLEMFVYFPMYGGYRWQRALDGREDVGLRFPKNETEKSLVYDNNVLDLDILMEVYEYA